jgi:hypothetical protein
MVVGTIWIAWSTKELRNFAEQQAKDMASQLVATNDALRASNTQAEAATTANQLSRSALFNSVDAARKQLRPYLVFDSHGIKNYETAMTFKNVGQTPALKITTHLRGAITNGKRLINFYRAVLTTYWKKMIQMNSSRLLAEVTF